MLGIFVDFWLFSSYVFFFGYRVMIFFVDVLEGF